MSDKNKPIGIRDLIEQVKAELTAPHSDHNPVFAVSRVELTISFTVERGQDGGIDLQVIKTGAAKTTTEVQTVVVTLDPLIAREEVRADMTSEQIVEAKKAVKRDGLSLADGD